ncbi:LacI family DNA-binding transcriptional regulator [Paenarthrobacter ureafaciens]|uniref:LacI family DNA-binding transcriptional regulator n=1 Tax=Paenarthrobacter ureafaciens TaxID=37931 RepID=UPI000FEC377E|nr:LacI family DNA-binding transcriptional regulator [Paenarthrobacter ureafaciens]RWW94510.1 LacI family transcriptional regulator [Paenarthrobacter ureafaciens]
MAASTLSEVARLAGVSLATASRVLNGSSRKPAEDIADRVRQAADKLGYVPNAQAQALAKSSSGLIGLIVHDIADPYFSAIARGVQGAAREQNRMVLLASTSGSPAEEREAVAAFAARRADSIVIAGSRSARDEDALANAGLAAELDRYCRNGGRVGVVGHPVVGASTTEGYRVVEVPNEELAADLARELADSHDAGFVVVAGPEGLFTSDDRVRGFQRGLAEAGRPAAEVIRTGFNRAGGYDAGLALAERITSAKDRLCIFAVNDVMAIGVTAALRSKGVWIPRDATIAGFDDIETLRDFRPALSTVFLPLEEIGRLAAGATEGGSVTGSLKLRRSTEVPAGDPA